MAEQNDKTVLQDIYDILKNLDKRVSAIESQISKQVEPQNIEQYEEETVEHSDSENTNSLEKRIGEYWFAKAGIIILIIGLSLLLSFPFQSVHEALLVLFGYSLSAGIFFIAKQFYKKNHFLADYLLSASIILLYVSSLRLHYWGNIKIIETPNIELLLLFFVVAISLFVSVKQKSLSLTSFSLLLGFITAFLSGNIFILSLSIILLAIFSGITSSYFNWPKLLTLASFTSYLIFIVWLLNNPSFADKNDFQTYSLKIIPVFIFALIYAGSSLFGKIKNQETFIDVVNSFINAFASYSLVLIISFILSSEYFGLYHLVFSAAFLVIASLYWIRLESKYSTFIYAMLAYLALSIGIVQTFRIQHFFIYLIWQSLLVLSTAVWYRSKFIVISNFLILVGLIFLHLVIEEDVESISLSVGIVSILSARILNWKKTLLNFNTEKYRTAYLVITFVFLLYALFKAFSTYYISVAWIGLALFYYLLSKMLNNHKYRLMAIFTLLITVLYVIILGFASAELHPKILSFLLLGVVLIVISVFYAKNRKKSESV